MEIRRGQTTLRDKLPVEEKSKMKKRRNASRTLEEWTTFANPGTHPSLSRPTIVGNSKSDDENPEIARFTRLAAESSV